MSGDGPKPIGEGVERFLHGLGAPTPEVTTAIVDRWADIMGAPLARVTTPGSLKDGVLTVTTTEPAVADHLKWSERTVVERANEVLGREAVRTVRARVVGPEMPR